MRYNRSSQLYKHGSSNPMITKKTRVPDINTYSSFKVFLEDLIHENKQRNKNFSLRYLASKLKWSPSHLNDILKGRRRVSLEKVLKLIEFLEIKGARAERLMLLALFDSNDVQEKGKEYLAALNSDREVKTLTEDQANILAPLQAQYIFGYLLWNDGVWNTADFLKRSPQKELPTEADLQSIINSMIHGRIIEWDKKNQRYTLLKKEFLFDDIKTGNTSTMRKAFTESLTAQARFIEKPIGKWCLVTGVIQISDDQLQEVTDRIISLRNYLETINRNTMGAAKTSKKVTAVYNYNIGLSQVFRTTKERDRQPND